MVLSVGEVAATETHALRRAVLRDGRPDAVVTFPGDELPETFHLAVRDDDGRIVGVGSFSPSPSPGRPDQPAWQLRGMAVSPDLQGRGIGRLLLDHAVARLRSAGADLLWAHGRDTALGFYRRAGWKVEGEGYLTSIGLPHHRVVLELHETGGGSGRG